MRSDRNLYSKNLIESQDEIAEMKRKFKIMNHQIEQLKEEIEAKDQVGTPPLSLSALTCASSLSITLPPTPSHLFIPLARPPLTDDPGLAIH